MLRSSLALPAFVSGAAALLAALALSGPVPAAEASATHRCSRFIVGEANSTAYPKLRLPARGRTTRVSCSALRSLARALNSGRVRLPDGAFAPAPAYGAPGKVRFAERTWRCAVQNIGSSGPSYRVRCTGARGNRASWSVG